MKDKKQILVIILLVVVIVFMGVIYSGQKRVENRLDDIDRNIYNNVHQAMGNLDYQIEQCLLNDKFMVADMDEDFPKSILRGEIAEGTIYFELIENKGFENIYVIIQGESAEDVMKIEAEDIGNLRYKVQVKLNSLIDYEYYVLGETKDDGEMMLSAKTYLGMSYRVYEKAYMTLDSAVTNASSVKYKGVLQVHESLEVEKVELELVEFDGFAETIEEQSKAKVIKSIDITDSVVAADLADVENAVMHDGDFYKYYLLDVLYKADDGENLLEYEFQGFRIVVTLSDGSTVELF